jgi:TIR domain
MSDLFVSYASENRVKVSALVRLFASAGWTVWWDRDIEGGGKWRKEIEDELATARCVLVLWSRASIKREWVIQEARTGLERDVLLPVLLEPVEPPDGFGEIQASRLMSWLGDERSFELKPLVHRVAAILKGSPPQLDENTIAAASVKMARTDVAEATFEFCAARLDFFRRNARGETIPTEVIDSLRITYDKLFEALSPITNDEMQELIGRFEGSSTQ